MKLVAVALVLLSANSAYSFQSCNQLEAQMVATVRSVETQNNGACRVLLSWSGSWMYNPSYVCPLDIDETSSFGVITTCEVKIGEPLSGIVYRNVNDGPENIYLY